MPHNIQTIFNRDGSVSVDNSKKTINNSVNINNKINTNYLIKSIKICAPIIIVFAFFVNDYNIGNTIKSLSSQVIYKTYIDKFEIFISNSINNILNEIIDNDKNTPTPTLVSFDYRNNKNIYKNSHFKYSNNEKCTQHETIVILLHNLRNDEDSFKELSRLTKKSCKLNDDSILRILNASDLQNDRLYTLSACILMKRSATITNGTLAKISINIRGDENRIIFNATIARLFLA